MLTGLKIDDLKPGDFIKTYKGDLLHILDRKGDIVTTKNGTHTIDDIETAVIFA